MRSPNASWVTGRTLSSGDGRQTANTLLSQPIVLSSRPPSRCVAARGFEKLGLRSELRSSFGLPSEVGTGPRTGGDATVCKPSTVATYATKNQRLSTTSWLLARSRVRSGGPFSPSLEPTRPWSAMRPFLHGGTVGGCAGTVNVRKEPTPSSR